MEEENKLNIKELYGSLLRHLSTGSKITSTSMEFRKLESNASRVAFTYDLLSQYKIVPKYETKNWKSNALSEKFRQEGNEMYKNHKNEHAIELYTKSIAHALPGSESLGLAYGNRSAALYDAKRYIECIQDVERAKEMDLPRQEEKLHARAVNAFERISDNFDSISNSPESDSPDSDTMMNSPDDPFEEIPKLASESNDSIKCSSNAVAIKNIPDLGRCVVAEKDIQVGNVIAIENPYAKILLSEASMSHCFHCLKYTLNPVPCEKCTFALFCNSECKEAATNEYHKYDCPLYSILIDLKVNKLTLLALRIAICARNEYSQITSYEKEKDKKYKSERYKEIHQLLACTDKRTNADLFERAITAGIIYILIKKYTNFFKDLKMPFKESKEMFWEILLHNMQTAPINFHEISELVKQDDIYTPVEIGAGAYSFLSMINHACAPNVVRHCYGTTIVLRALSPIAKGQELLDNYGYHYALMPKKERLEQLKFQYYFYCSCQACVDDWPLYHDLPVNNFELELPPEDVLDKLKKGDVNVASEMISSLIIKAAILENLKPCKNLADIQECLKQCYCVLANKRLL